MVELGSKLRATALGLGLFLLVWGGKILVIDHWGSDLPWWDDWDGIGGRLFVPYEQGRLSIAELFAPHNEHRILCTRAIDLLLLVLNGQWDARLECTVNAALHALIVVGAFFGGRRMLSPLAQFAWFAVLTAFTAPPVVWENIIRGFDSQHYCLIGFSFATIALLVTSSPLSARWWIGFGCSVLALFTMASGVVVVIVVALVLCATTPWRELWTRQLWTLIACVVVGATGAALHHHVPGGEAMHAHNFSEFFTAFWHHLQWPLVRSPFFGVLSYIPWLWLAWRSVRARATTSSGERVVVAVGLWALVHYVAMAYMRGSFQPWPPTRGLENIVVGLLANAYVLLLGWSRLKLTSTHAWLRLSASCAGAAIGLYGLGSIIQENVQIVLPWLAAKARLAETNTRAFLATGDPAQLKSGELPYPNATGLAYYLTRPELAAALPVSVRKPLPLTGDSTPPESFAPGAVPAGSEHPAHAAVIGSHGARGVVAQGEWRSAPIPRGRFDNWTMEIAGTPGAHGIALNLVENGVREIATFSPPGSVNTTWNTFVVHAPRDAVTLVARDQNADAWIAFTAPTEIAAGSIAVRALGRHGWWFVYAGVLVSAVGWLRRPRVS